MRLFSTLVLGLSLLASTALPQQAPRRAPGFAIFDQSQKMHDMQDYKGKIVLLDFMQTSCPHCQQLTGTLEQVKAKYGDKVVVLSVVVPPDSVAQVNEYRTKFKMTSPVLFDCGQVTASYLRITPQNPQVTFPHLMVVDRNGLIQYEAVHKTEADTQRLALPAISAAVDKLLK